MIFFIKTSFKLFLVKNESQALLVENGITIGPKTIIDYITELEIVAILTKKSTSCNIVGKSLYFYLFFDIRFSSLE